MKKIITAVTIVTLLFPLFSSCATKTILVKCPPSGASIKMGAHVIGNQEASFKTGMYGAYITVSAPNYITQQFLVTNKSSNLYEICLEQDNADALLASVPASDIANKNIRFTATTDKNDDEIWYSIIRYASDYFGDFTVNDKGAGWAKSTWVTKSFSKIKIRTRLEIKRNPGNKKEFTIYIASEVTNKGCNDDECYQQWDRVLKTYVELPNALKTAVQ